MLRANSAGAICECEEDFTNICIKTFSSARTLLKQVVLSFYSSFIGNFHPQFFTNIVSNHQGCHDDRNDFGKIIYDKYDVMPAPFDILLRLGCYLSFIQPVPDDMY